MLQMFRRSERKKLKRPKWNNSAGNLFSIELSIRDSLELLFTIVLSYF